MTAAAAEPATGNPAQHMPTMSAALLNGSYVLYRCVE